MAQAQVLQGSWQELAAHSEEFRERDDLLLIIPPLQRDTAQSPPKGQSLAEALQGKTGLVSFEPTDLSENTGKKFADLLFEREQGQTP